jgi:two-component system, chemotaxis family, sensor kinase CheA
MDNAHAIYLEEANELFGSLETTLLTLEGNPFDKSNIEEAFRVMHTLKGNSSMFGLNKIASFLHNLETTYDHIRSGELQVSKELLTVTLAALDHLKRIIHDPEITDAKNAHNHVILTEQINGFTIDGATPKIAPDANAILAAETSVFHIYFQPETNIFNNGTNPLLLLSELTGMGNSRVVPHLRLPTQAEQIRPNECITYWDIFLETAADENQIRDVFVFVEGNSVIQIKQLPGSDYLNSPELNKLIDAAMLADLRIDLEAVLAIANRYIKEQPEQTASVGSGDGLIQETRQEDQTKTISRIRVGSDKLDELMNLVSELVTIQAGLSLYTDRNKESDLVTISENVEKLSRRLRDVAFSMTLIPINNMFGRFQRLVRDTADFLDKEVVLITEGGETELDKTIIESLTDPLMHLIRNSLDHGIEKADVREKAGKERIGTIQLRAYYSGIFVYIQISDDGNGIDTEVVRKKAISKGLINEQDTLTEKEIFDLIFLPGFSTAETISDVSGRGVGMDVVKQNISSMKGSIAVASKLGEGTSMTIKLPLTLSIIDGLLVTVHEVNYIIPLSVISKCYEVPNVEMVGNFNRLLSLEGEQVPYISLRGEFGHEIQTEGYSHMIVVSNDERKVGIGVDSITGEYQAVIKPLGKYYKRQDFVSGATILGDGTVALVLDTNKIIELYVQNAQVEEKV